ncbi:hypothetical protein GQ44DRAFT_628257, partial [Phaeosphaeriaceae sp. PMI808]
FRRLNSSICANGAGLTTGKSYCVDAAFDTVPTPSPTPSTAPFNAMGVAITKLLTGIETQQPAQPDMVGNCDAFYFVKSHDTCAGIAQHLGTTVSGNNCAGLRAQAYACISVIDHTPTPAQPGNSIATPLLTQSGMIS